MKIIYLNIHFFVQFIFIELQVAAIEQTGVSNNLNTLAVVLTWGRKCAIIYTITFPFERDSYFWLEKQVMVHIKTLNIENNFQLFNVKG